MDPKVYLTFIQSAVKEVRKECKPARFRTLAADKSNYMPWFAFLETTMKNLQPPGMRLNMWRILINDETLDEEKSEELTYEEATILISTKSRET